MADRARARRLAKRIAQIVASELEHGVKDPRLTMVTVTDAKITADLRDATVYYTVFGDDADYDGAAAALASATGVLRSRVGQQTGVRFTPTLTFIADNIPAQAKRLDELLVQAKEADAEVARLASTASPAGDSDPYRVAGEEDEEGEHDSDVADFADSADAAEAADVAGSNVDNAGEERDPSQDG